MAKRETLPRSRKAERVTSEYRLIAIQNISFEEYQARIRQNKDGLRRSVAKHGLINAPEVIEVAPQRYRLVTGLGRLQTAQEAGKTMIECKVLPGLSDLEILDRQFAENEHRDSWHPYDLARLVKVYTDKGVKQVDLAPKIGLRQSDVSKLLKVATLPPTISRKIMTSYKRHDREPLYIVAELRNERDQSALLNMAINGAPVTAMRAAAAGLARRSRRSRPSEAPISQAAPESRPPIAASTLKPGNAHLVLVDCLDIIYRDWKRILTAAERVVACNGIALVRVDGPEMAEFLSSIPTKLRIEAECFVLLRSVESRSRGRLVRYFILSADSEEYGITFLKQLAHFTDFSNLDRKASLTWRGKFLKKELPTIRGAWKHPTVVDFFGTWNAGINEVKDALTYVHVMLD